MQTRRVFLKILLGLGAATLPWSLLPTLFRDAVKTKLVLPPVQLLLPPRTNVNNVINAENLGCTALDDISALTSSEMQGRRAGSKGEVRAAEYLSSQLSMLGLKPMGDSETGFAHVFTLPRVTEILVNGRLTFKSEPIQLRIPSVNLLGALIGKKTEEIILLSAHYDHLGIFKGQIYPGANDNASGVGCVLDVMRRILREGKTPRRTIILAFWSAEEMGFVGSKAFVRSAPFPLHYIQAVFNVDTIGNGMIGDFALWTDGENLAFRAIRQAATEVGASVQRAPQGAHNSDSISFASVGIPAVTLMARDWLYKNHTTEDNIELLKPEQINLASEIVYRAVQILAF
ncbi:MAG: M28 family metallopeptidase [Desulfosporosinus sp.]|jgi:aminopeptidase YwaD